MKRLASICSAVFACCCASVAWSQATPVVLHNARIIPIDGPEIERGHVVMQDGKIRLVGSGPAPIADDVTSIDCEGKVVMPGLVDTHSHIGGFGGADGSGPIQPGVRIRDSLNVLSSGFKRALSGGLTTINVMPGSGHLSSGQTAYLKLRYGGDVKTIDDVTIFDADGEPTGGLKMANGTNSQRASEGAFPGTRGRSAFLVREKFIKAQEYQVKLAKAEDDPDKAPARDLDMETLVEVLEGKRVVHHHTHRHDDIITVMRLAKEFGFRVVLHHVSDGWLVADEIAEAGVGVSAILVDSPGGKHEAVGLRFETPGILERAGVQTVVHTDDWIVDSRLFMRMAAFAVRGGMTREGALRAITLTGAELLDLDERIGSLTVGKDADVVVLSGDPLSVYTVVEQTWVEGELAFDRSSDEDRLFAVGGYGAANDTEPYFCCYDAEVQAAETGGAK